VKSGIYFIGTTNYPERIDSAFMNRSGRFDRSYEIPNPNDTIRRAFFRSCKIGELLNDYKFYKDNSENSNMTVVDLFVKYSDGLSMANLKELMISTQYMLISNRDISIEEALENNFNMLTKIKKEHDESHNEYEDRYNYRKYMPKSYKF
jgi:SpoVK/Ycf46/Vps4 family AAA+-type ATPase